MTATKRFDVPTQNLVYADRDGNTLYYVTGKIPIQTVNGEDVPGDRIFDGSASESEWQGFTPFGMLSWEGFIPFSEKPHVINPDYIGTANQRMIDSPDHHIAEAYADPYRGARIYDRIDRRAQSEKSIDTAFVKRIQCETRDLHVQALAPQIVDPARESNTTKSETQYVDALDSWDYRMERDSTAALVFARWFENYRKAVFGPTFEQHGLDSSYYPTDWVLQHFSPDSLWFGDDARAAVIVRTLRQTVSEIKAAEYDTYGGDNMTIAMIHPLGLSFLNYPAIATDGSRATVNNYAVEKSTGSSWRIVVSMDGSASGGLPGGNSGAYFSEDYDDQLQMWADGKYKSMSCRIRGTPALTF